MWNTVRLGDDEVYVARNTPVENIAVLVTDKKHHRFGQLGRLILHDLHGGIYDVSFAEGREDVPDIMNQDSPVKVFDRTKDADKLIQAYLALGIGDQEKLKTQYNSLFSNYQI